MKRSVGAVLVLYVFWLLLSGYFTAFLMTMGLLSAIAIVALSRRMQVIDHESPPLHLGGWAFFSYWPWLLKEIVKSAWSVSRIILSPKLPISPVVVKFSPMQRSDLGLVIHANSITLTPGTIAVEASRGEFVVHALTRDGAAGLAGSEMDARVAAIEGKRRGESNV